MVLLFLLLMTCLGFSLLLALSWPALALRFGVLSCPADPVGQPKPRRLLRSGLLWLPLPFAALFASTAVAKPTDPVTPGPLGAGIALQWFAAGSGLAADGSPLAQPWAGAWPGTGGAGLHLAALTAPQPAPLGAASGLPPDEAEDRQARLGAAFLAEVMGPRPRLPLGLGRGAAGLRDLIARFEAGRAGYDAVVFGATVAPPAAPTQLTIAQIRAWVAATPGQNHAIGRYQMVPRTFDGLVRRLSLADKTRFSPEVQDRMADVLIADAGYHEFLAGKLPRRAFMENLAAIWAALPRSDGRSAYHGINGNRAGLTWAAYLDAMAQIFP